MLDDYDLYFVRIPDGPVKIGRAKSVPQRMQSLQCGSPWKLELLGIRPKAGGEESFWHMAFYEQQMHGEWFEWSEEIGAAIERALGDEDWTPCTERGTQAAIKDYIAAMDAADNAKLQANGSLRSIIVAYLRRGAAVMLTSDMAELHDPEDRREIETAARALEAAADEIEKGAHIG